MVGNGFRLDPDFRKLWIGQAISQIGSNITGVGLPLTAVLVLKASPLQMGFLSGVRTKDTDAYCWMNPLPASWAHPDYKTFWKAWWRDHESEVRR